MHKTQKIYVTLSNQLDVLAMMKLLRFKAKTTLQNYTVVLMYAF